jgi:hypothetical protein
MMAVMPLFGVGAMTGAETEIQRIEHELQILRARYALFAKCARIMKVFCAVVIPLTGVLIVVLILRAFPEDVTAALFFIGIYISTAAIITWLCLSRSPPEGGPRHWLDARRMIDLISPQRPLPWYNWYSTGPFSEAQEIERMITVREQRLAEIRGARP